MKLDSLLKKSFEKRVSDLPYAIKIARNVINRCALNYDDFHQAYANCYLGYYYMILSDTEQSEKYTNKAIPYFESHKVDSGLAMCYYTIGSILYKSDNYHKALKYLLESLELFQNSDDKFGQARSLKTIGSVYEFFEDYEKAEETYLKCVEIADKNKDYNGVSNAYNPLSGIYLRKGEIDLAEETINRSIELKKKTKDTRGLAFAYYGEAKVALAKQEYKKAEEKLILSQNIHFEKGDRVGQMMSLNKLGKLFFETSRIDLAKKCLQESLVIGEKSKHYLVMYKACYQLYEIAKSEGSIQEALTFLERHNDYKKLVNDKDTQNVISSIKSLSEMELLEQETVWQKTINESIEKKNKELDTFVYKVAHDLRGPITSLMGLHTVVEHDIHEKKSLEYFDIYNKQISRLNNIVLDFINITQIKEKKLEKEKITFEPLINEIVNSYRYLDNFESIKFNIKVDKAIEFYSDLSTITTIVQNLIENAIKYSKQGESGLVKIKVYGRKRDIAIIVDDNGVGIEKHNQNKIFDMFFRAQNDTKGTGLGLYLLKSAVEKLGGEVNLESDVSRGTTFKIILPY